VEARGVHNIRARPKCQAEDTEEKERGSRVKLPVSLSKNKNPLSKGEIWISLENEAEVKNENR